MNATTRELWCRGICLGLALSANGLLIGGSLLWRPEQIPATDATRALVMVDLDIAPAPSPPALPPPQRPPETRPIPHPASPQEPRTIERIIPEPFPRPAQNKQSFEHLPQTSDALPSPVPPLTDFAPAPQPSASTTHPQAVTSWQQQLLAHLQHYRRYPAQARRLRQQGIAHVRFSVDRLGQISHPRIEHPSGHRLLDEETLATVHRANPVPPPPADITGNPVDVVVPVSFHLRRR